MSNLKSGRGRRSARPNQNSSSESAGYGPRSAGNRKEIIVNVSNRETRIALLEDSKLTEYRVEREERVVGSIFKGIVQNVLPGMDAAFVDIGLERNAFLYVADIIPDDAGDNSPASVKRSELRRRKIKDLLKPGQQVMVQVTKGPRGTKGARVSTRIALPGRYVVLMPEAGSVGVSRKIEDRSERERLRKIGDRIIPDGFGLILRTECESRTEAELKADVGFLQHLWADVLKTAKKMRAPACVHKDQTLLFRTVRDMFGENITRMVIDDPDEYEKVHLVASQVAPQMRDKIELYDRDTPLFDHYGIEKELERIMQHKVPLKAGGSLVIDEMEALTAIDVNTGKNVGSSSLNDTILRQNLEAADEIFRQLRLRDMGGIIVCDFIDMESEADRKKLLDHFVAGLANDRARTRVGRVSSLGLIELTRKRTGESVTQEITEICPMCTGIGRIASKETVSLWIERDMWRKIHEAGNAFLIECHPSVVEALIGLDGENVEELEHEMRRGIYIRANFDMEYEEYEIRSGTIEEFDRQFMGYRRAQVLEANVRRSAFENSNKVIGWTDSGFYIELLDGNEYLGGRAKVCLQDIRRSYAVADVILPGTGAPVRSLA
ncbi:Rne/Rng family ribonuclease [Fimbriimonas ginsengisoli]|uniref:RNAse G n=1 Tax=Fimbriimonas ginsengisoli Gsoil 348 TaxID=661478 RepID=A0A068NTU6_FIMGI|nr:Rne/Rng family ribonuclease [Fimbriimonas ginsengisoli]AIE86180.1 RNAse G [Fimbriimonas ginsengisoli Gsoil 348]